VANQDLLTFHQGRLSRERRALSDLMETTAEDDWLRHFEVIIIKQTVSILIF
jgi:hypothetical protein